MGIQLRKRNNSNRFFLRNRLARVELEVERVAQILLQYSR